MLAVHTKQLSYNALVCCAGPTIQSLMTSNILVQEGQELYWDGQSLDMPTMSNMVLMITHRQIEASSGILSTTKLKYPYLKSVTLTLVTVTQELER